MATYCTLSIVPALFKEKKCQILRLSLNLKSHWCQKVKICALNSLDIKTLVNLLYLWISHLVPKLKSKGKTKMTMIPPKIRKLPGLHKPNGGYIAKPQQGTSNSNRSLYMGGAKMIK